MSNKTTFEVTGVARLDVSQVKQAAEQVKSSLQGITLPGNIDRNLTSIFQRLNDEIAEFEVNSKKATTSADWSNVIKSGEKILGLYSKMEGQIRQLGDVSESEMKNLFPPEVTDRIKKAEQAIKAYTIATEKNADAIKRQQSEVDKLAKKQSKAKANRDTEQGKTQVSNGEYAAMISQQKALGKAAAKAAEEVDRLQTEYDEMTAARAGKRGRKPQELLDTQQQLEQAKIAYAEATQAAQAFDQKMQSTTSPKILADLDKALNEATVNLDAAKQKLAELGQNDTASLNQLFTALSQIDGVDLSNVTRDLEGAKQAIENLTADQIKKVADNLAKVQSTADSASPAMDKFRGSIDDTKSSIQDLNSMQSQVESLKNSFLQFFSLTNGWMLLRRGIRAAYESVKEMDAAMTEIAVVSEYTLDDVWEMRDTYVKAASDMGASTIDLVNATKLYVQQGMNLTEAQEVGIETTKMARIANLDGAEATNLMTAALRGFNMEMNEANRVNDVYSQLAAKSAADTEEIATAMSKTASIAANAGASFENTSAFLTQIIETTREAPETAGTALKTIIARFQELKKAPSEIGEVDGEIVNANAIETALKTAGVELRNAQGEFRNFDDVIIELAGKWDSLDVMTQRYIATMAAGSRQQSRFIALMADSERLMELTGYAANSAGASQEQFNKTLESLESKMNRLRNAWELYLQNLTNSTIIKTAIDLLSNLLETVNKTTAGLNKIDITKIGLFGSAFQTMLTFFAFKSAGTLISKAFATFGPMFFASGQQAGVQYSTGVASGIAKGQVGIRGALKKIKALFTKEAWLNKPQIIQWKVNTQGLEKLRTALNNSSAAQANYEAIATKSRVSDKKKAVAAAEVAATTELKKAALADLGVTEAQYNTIQGLGLTQDQMDIALSNKEVMSRLLEIASIKGLTDARREELIAQALAEKQTRVGILTRIGYIAQVLFSRKATEKDAEGHYTNAAAIWMETAAKNGNILAQWALNAAIYACPLGWILVIILAAVAAFVILAKVIETDAEKMERLTKESEDARKALDKTQEAYKELQDELNDYKDLKNGLATMVEGTNEWNQQLEKVNQQVMDLINLYPQLAKYLSVTDAGEMTISGAGIAALEQESRNAVAFAQTAATSSQVALLQEQQRQLWNTTFGPFEDFMDLSSNQSGYNLFSDESTQKLLIDKWGTAQGRAEMRQAFASEQYAIIGSTGPGGYYYDQFGNHYNEAGFNSDFFGKSTYEDSYGIHASEAMKALSEEFNVSAEVLWATQDYIIQWLDQWYIYNDQIQSYSKALGKQVLSSIDIADQYESGLAQVMGDLYTNNIAAVEAVQEDAIESDFATGSGDQTGGLLSKYAIADTGSERGNLEAIYKYLYKAVPEEGLTDEQLMGMISAAEKTQAVQQEIVDLQSLMYGDYNLAQILSLNLDASTAYDTSNLNDFQRAAVNAATEKIKEQQEGIEKYLSTYYAPQTEISEEDQEEINWLKKRQKEDQAELDRLQSEDGKSQWEEEYKAARDYVYDSEQMEQDYLDAVQVAKETLSETSQKVLDYAAAVVESAAGQITDKLGYSIFVQAQTLTSQIEDNFGHLGVDAASIFAQFLYQGQDIEGIKEQLGRIDENWDFSTSIAAAATFRDMLASTDEEIRHLGQTLQNNDAGFSNLTSQFAELTNAINTDTLKELNEDGAITYEEVIGLSKTVPQLATVLEDSTISVSGMGKALKMYQEGTITADDLTGDFIRTLMRLDAVANMTADAFGFIDTFQADRSTQEIGQFFSEMREAITTAYEQGRYNDPQLISNIKALVGEEAWDKATGNLKDKIEKFLPIVESLSENFYSFWTMPAGKEDGFITQLANGSLKMDLSQFSSLEEVIQHIQDAWGVTKDVANAALTDFSTYSEDVNKGLQALEQLGAIQSMVEGAQYSEQLGGFLIDEAELKERADALGIAVDDVRNQIISQNKDKKFIFKAIIGEDGGFTTDAKQMILDKLAGEDGIATGAELQQAMSMAYHLALEVGLDDSEAKAELNKLFNNMNEQFSDMEFGFSDDTLNESLKNIALSTTTGIQAGVSNEENFAKLANLSDAQQKNMFTATFVAITSAIGSALATMSNMTTTIAKTSGAFGFTRTTYEEVPVFELKDEQGNPLKGEDLAKYYNEQAIKEADAILAQTVSDNSGTSGGDPTINLEGLKSQIAEILKALSYTNPNSQLGGGEGFGDNDKSDTWEHDYDWLYNEEKKLAKLVRQRNKLENEYNRLITEGNFTQEELIAKMREQTDLENKQLTQLEREKKLRTQEKNNLKSEYADVSQYTWWNEAEQRVEIDYDKIDALSGTENVELGERIDKAVEEFERIQDELEQIEDDTNDIKDTQADRLREQLDQYVSLEERLYDAIVSEREKEIEELETINDTVSDAASEMLDKIQTGIDDYRQAREDEEAMEDISKMEQRLAMMRTDTSGANALDILSLEEELEQARQDFMDNKIDQAIDQLSRQNELAQKQREKQIELMQRQLKQDQDSGAIAKQVNNHLSKLASTGDDSVIRTILQSGEGWRGMAAQQKKDWADELISTVTQAGEGWRNANAASNMITAGSSITFTDKNGNAVKGTMQSDGNIKDGSGNTYSGVFLGADGKYHQYADGNITVKPKDKTATTTTTASMMTTTATSSGTEISDAVKKRVALAIWNGATQHGWMRGDERKRRLTEVFGAGAANDIQAQINRGSDVLQKEVGSVNYGDYSYSNMKNTKWKKYETGGLADFTGPAWLDGTKARPEYVLNAEQTQGFLALVDMLGDFNDNPTAGGNNYYDVRIEVDELSNDYDVEQLMDKMKRVIVDDAMYRNVNAIDLGRR